MSEQTPYPITRSGFELAVELAVATHDRDSVEVWLHATPRIDAQGRVDLERAIAHCAWYYLHVSRDMFTDTPLVPVVREIARENKYKFLPEESSDETNKV